MEDQGTSHGPVAASSQPLEGFIPQSPELIEGRSGMAVGEEENLGGEK